MALVLASLRSRVYDLLNASPNTYGTLANVRWQAGAVDAALIAADGRIIEAICSNKNHPRRKAFLTGTGSDVAHGSSLTSRIGPLESVSFVIDTVTYPGTELSIAQMGQLNRENQNPDALTSIDPHYILDGDTIYHNKAGLILGGAAAVAVNTTFCVYAVSAALQAPDENEDDVIDEAMRMLRPKEGAALDAAGLHGGWALQGQDRIRNIPVGPRPVMESPE
jgi:hypothetical protein